MNKTSLLAAVFAVALLPAAGMATDNNKSFNDDAKWCDSWTWLDAGQSSNRNRTAVIATDSERVAFGDSRYNIGW